MMVGADGGIVFMNTAAVELVQIDSVSPASSKTMNIDSIPLLSIRRRLRRALRLPSEVPVTCNDVTDDGEIDIVVCPAKCGGKFIFIRKSAVELTDRFFSRTQQIYGLTPQEARIAHHLSGGRLVEEIAARLRVQPNTVRMHLKRIYEKTGTTCQSQLVSRLASNIFLTAVA
jgi:DNA-binding CsgD family transcriptional regulator